MLHAIFDQQSSEFMKTSDSKELPSAISPTTAIGGIFSRGLGLENYNILSKGPAGIASGPTELTVTVTKNDYLQ